MVNNKVNKPKALPIERCAGCRRFYYVTRKGKKSCSNKCAVYAWREEKRRAKEKRYPDEA